MQSMISTKNFKEKAIQNGIAQADDSQDNRPQQNSGSDNNLCNYQLIQKALTDGGNSKSAVTDPTNGLPAAQIFKVQKLSKPQKRPEEGSITVSEADEDANVDSPDLATINE